MKIPCDCWDGGKWIDGSGRAVCGNCGTKQDVRDLANQPFESIVTYAARKASEQVMKNKEAQKIHNVKVKPCTFTECGWFDEKKNMNCYRDPGDCRFVKNN